MSWEKAKIKDLIEKPISGEWGEGEGSVNVIRTTNFNNDGSLNLKDVVRRNIVQKKVLQKRLVFGDTIIEKSGGSPSQPVGRVVYFNIEDDIFLCNNFTSVIRSKSELDKRYLFWFLFGNHLNQNTLKYQNKTTGIINLQLERYITDLEIPLPPLPIQKRIAEILDAADALRRKDQELMRKYDELAQAIFIDMFGDPVKNEKGWEVKELDDVCSKITDGEHGTVERFENGKLYLMARNIRDNVFDLNDVDYVSQSQYELINKRCNPEVGDILLVCVGATIGRAAIVPEMEPFCLARSVALLKLDQQKILPFFLYSFIKSDFMQSKIQRAGNSSAQAGLYTGKIKCLPIYLPPLSLQIKYESLMKVLLEKKLKLNLSFTYSQNLFASLLQQAFKGELVK